MPSSRSKSIDHLLWLFYVIHQRTLKRPYLISTSNIKSIKGGWIHVPQCIWYLTPHNLWVSTCISCHILVGVTCPFGWPLRWLFEHCFMMVSLVCVEGLCFLIYVSLIEYPSIGSYTQSFPMGNSCIFKIVVYSCQIVNTKV